MADPLLESFREELLTLLGSLESGLLELEAQPGRERLDAVFRAAHNIKSAAAMVGLPALAAAAHRLEAVLDALRAGDTAVERALVSRLLEAADLLRALARGEGAAGEAERVLAELDAASARAARPAPPAERVVRVALRLAPDALARGLDPLRLLVALGALGEVASAGLDAGALPDLEALDPDRLYLGFRLELRTRARPEELRAVLLFAEGQGEVELSDPAAPAGPAPGVGATAAPALETLTVGVARVDALVDLASELLVASSRLEHLRQEGVAPSETRMEAASREVRRLASRVQEAAMSIRLVPLAPTFLALRRHVRELAEQLGKQVEVELEGGAAEVDKSVAERLLDPLKHLVRNAVDHGLEPAAERERQGKPASGRLRLAAREEQGQLQVVVEDDGRGIDPARVREAAVRRGLLPPEAAPGEAELLALLFKPGFTTAAEVGPLSGRGVGLDVVQRNLADLGGEVAVSSRPGQGARFTLSVPLTLAVFEGLVLRSGEERLVVPLDLVQRLLRPAPGQVARLPDGRAVLRLSDEVLPVVRPAERFGFPGAEGANFAVVAGGAAGRAALLVDEVLDQEAVLLKPLHRALRYREGVLGAAVLGDGRVALVVDLPHLLASAAPAEAAPSPGGA